MTKKPGYTTTADLPADVQELYELTAVMEGGPVFDLPNVRQTGVDFSKLTLHQAEVLLKRNWKGIRLKAKPEPTPPAAKTPDTPPALPVGQPEETATDATPRIAGKK